MSAGCEGPAPLYRKLRLEDRGTFHTKTEVQITGAPLKLTITGQSSLYGQRPVYLSLRAQYHENSELFEFNLDTIRIICRGIEMRRVGRVGHYVPPAGLREGPIGGESSLGDFIEFDLETDLPYRYDRDKQMRPDELIIVLDGLVRYRDAYLHVDTVMGRSF
jgi:hypothetical protein